MTPITTERLLLRPLHQDDAATIAREINHFDIARNLARVPFPYELRHAGEFISWTATLDEKSAVCAVEEKTNPGLLIGVCSFEWSAAKQDAEFGYWYARHVWGKGYATEAATAVVRHAFEQACLAKLVSCCHNDNDASRRVLEKVGFQAMRQCTNFSIAQNREVAVTTMYLTRENWDQNTRRT
jgi:RimJ/RimL family protein N-acetyltransferase